jgi:transcriptional regulator with XRE-family HTH domain
MDGAEMAKKALQKKGWSQRMLADHLGVTSGAVSRWLAGERFPCLAQAVRLREALGVPEEVWVRKR